MKSKAEQKSMQKDLCRVGTWSYDLEYLQSNSLEVIYIQQDFYTDFSTFCLPC